MNPAQHTLVLFARIYRAAVSPLLTVVFGPLGFGCRFTPTCSDYAMDAVKIHGAVKGCGLALGRLCRCQPWGGSGPDPVPPATPVPYLFSARSAAVSAASSGTVPVPGEETPPRRDAAETRNRDGCATPNRYPVPTVPPRKTELSLNPAQHGS